MRLIDADALKETICNNVYPIRDFFNSRDYGMFWTGGIEKAIDEAPTIEAEPVIRCIDCKYFQCNMRPDGSLPFGVDEYECRHWCGYCDPMDFCSYGERREDVKVD